MLRRKLLVSCLLALSLSGFAAAETAYPTRMIRATIPFGAGSATDVVPRLVFERLSAELGQPIVVENRAGAGGTLGTGLVAKSDPDGYALLAHSSALTIAPAIFQNLTFDAAKDLSAVLMIGSSANVMIVSPSRPWKTVQDFLAAAKAKDAAISFASVGIGSAVHISAEKFKLAGDFEATHVPYRGGSEAIADILGGRVDFYFCPLATALPLIREGQVRALVVSTKSRAPDLPDVPTTSEAGLVNADSTIWFGIFAPSATPRPIIDRLHAAGEKVLANPDMQVRLKQLGVAPMPMSPQAIDALVLRDLADNREVIRRAGIKSQ